MAKGKSAGSVSAPSQSAAPGIPSPDTVPTTESPPVGALTADKEWPVRSVSLAAATNLQALLWWLRDRCNVEKPGIAGIQAWVGWKVSSYAGTQIPLQQPAWDPSLDDQVVFYLSSFEQTCYGVQGGWQNLNGGTANFNSSARAELKRIVADRQGTGTVSPNSNLEKFLWWLRARANADKPGISGLESWVCWRIDSYNGTGIPGSQPSWSSQLSAQVIVFLESFEQASYYAQGGWANLNGNPADLNDAAEAQLKRVLDRCPPPNSDEL